MSGKYFMFIFIILCGHIGLVYTQDHVDGHGCEQVENFCPSTDRCHDVSEACDGQCREDYHLCSSSGSCLHDSEACDGQCGEDYHFCPYTDDCIKKSTPCDGNCPEDAPNLCDNGTRCYSNSSINGCVDRSDEHRPTEESPPMYNSSIDKLFQLNTEEDKFDVGKPWCKGRNFPGGRECCEASDPHGSKCTEGQGDCDADAGCAGDLVCRRNSCKHYHEDASPDDDCCTTAGVGKPWCKGRNFLGGWDCCQSTDPHGSKCTEGQGDCDSDAGCAEGLVCGNNNCRQ